jgi:hypothetical protein
MKLINKYRHINCFLQVHGRRGEVDGFGHRGELHDYLPAGRGDNG